MRIEPKPLLPTAAVRGLLLCIAGLLATPIAAATFAAALEPTEKALRYAFETARPGSTLTLPAGRIVLRRPLVMYADNVTIRGAGSGHSATDTILAFDRQRIGAEAMRLSGNGLIVEHFAIENARGDALKIFDARDLVIRHVRTEWTRGAHRRNGAYGIYPVQSEDVLLEHNIARGAADAGIYVGQSRRVVVRHNRVFENVAGIEAENCESVDIYANHAHDNTAGVLVFHLPDIPLVSRFARVYDNQIEHNNTPNFASPGTAVARVPSGTGLMVMAAKEVEVFNNRFANNQDAAIVVAHGRANPAPETSPYDAVASGIAILPNQFAADPPVIRLPADGAICQKQSDDSVATGHAPCALPRLAPVTLSNAD